MICTTCTTLHHHTFQRVAKPLLHHCTTCTTPYREVQWWWCGFPGFRASGLTVADCTTLIEGEPGQHWAWGGMPDMAAFASLTGPLPQNERFSSFLARVVADD